MDEFKSYIVSAAGTLIVLFLPLFFETNPLWIVCVLIFILLMIIRCLLGEISRKAEKIFIALNLIALLFSIAAFII